MKRIMATVLILLFNIQINLCLAESFRVFNIDEQGLMSIKGDSTLSITPYLSILGSRFEEELTNGVVNIDLDPELYSRLNKIVFMGIEGTVEHGFTKSGFDEHIIDLMDWESNQEWAMEDFENYLILCNYAFENLYEEREENESISYIWIDKIHLCMVVGWFSENKIHLRWYLEPNCMHYLDKNRNTVYMSSILESCNTLINNNAVFRNSVIDSITQTSDTFISDNGILYTRCMDTKGRAIRQFVPFDDESWVISDDKLFACRIDSAKIKDDLTFDLILAFGHPVNETVIEDTTSTIVIDNYRMDTVGGRIGYGLSNILSFKKKEEGKYVANLGLYTYTTAKSKETSISLNINLINLFNRLYKQVTPTPTIVPTQEPVYSQQPTQNSIASTTKPSTYSYTSFTNESGTPTTKCAHTGCSNYIASSGDTYYCEAHSNRCLQCGKYIDEDALYCVSCIIDALIINSIE